VGGVAAAGHVAGAAPTSRFCSSAASGVQVITTRCLIIALAAL